MSDTPETDQKAVPHIGFYSCATVPAEFARKLERERDEAIKHWEEVREYGTDEINAAVDLRQKLAQALVERDEARGILNKISDLFIDGTDIYADYENMGMLARNALEETK